MKDLNRQGDSSFPERPPLKRRREVSELPVCEIGEDAFANCSALKSITPPEGIAIIGVTTFRKTTKVIQNDPAIYLKSQRREESLVDFARRRLERNSLQNE